jgi:hypothetical protein
MVRYLATISCWNTYNDAICYVIGVFMDDFGLIFLMILVKGLVCGSDVIQRLVCS